MIWVFVVQTTHVSEEFKTLFFKYLFVFSVRKGKQL